MHLGFRERAMLKAAYQLPRPKLDVGELVVAISPTRGAQLAKVARFDGYVRGHGLVRIGGPQNYLEEAPDFLTDAKPFLAIDVTTRLIRDLTRKLEKAEQQRDEALERMAAMRANGVDHE
ncbi:MAG: hypothetical protein ACRETY_01480 [Steroidobacteraceae bacterium]